MSPLPQSGTAARVDRQIKGMAEPIGTRLQTREKPFDAAPLIRMDEADPDDLKPDRLDESDTTQVFRTRQ